MKRITCLEWWTPLRQAVIDLVLKYHSFFEWMQKNLQRIVVLPALSNPRTKIRASLSPKKEDRRENHNPIDNLWDENDFKSL